MDTAAKSATSESIAESIDESIEVKTATGVVLTLPLAGAGSRSYAYLIDWHIRILVVLVWVFGWSQIFGAQALSQFEEAGRSQQLWLILFPSLFYLLYHPLIELVMGGSSPGKKIAKLACVNQQGGAPTPGQILLRNFMRVIDSLPAFYTLGTLCVILTKEHLRLGDMAAGTRIISVADKGSDALKRLDQIERAAIDNKDAEFVQNLLDRWDALGDVKRTTLATKLLARHSIEPESSARKLKAQIKGLLDA